MYFFFDDAIRIELIFLKFTDNLLIAQYFKTNLISFIHCKFNLIWIITGKENISIICKYSKRNLLRGVW